ncbi:hypothetical protein OE88DRAFT_1418293 [Heliocybe sulcata]|uniref:Uncharacterized protein n=1 Tax=Heliocybe sulcata TaxID=5364 RepID=A0A5C3N544_9AGAM|nr:hypothetical protein OE88DRAFT_1418293 [Heliocybe sulcata]
MKGYYNPLKFVQGSPEKVLKGIATFGPSIFLWAWLENDKDRRQQERTTQYEPPVPFLRPSEVAWTEGVKLAVALAWYLWRRRSEYQPLRQGYRSNELRNIHARDSNDARSPVSERRGGVSWRDVSNLPVYGEFQYGQIPSKRARASAAISLGLLYVGYAERAAVANLLLDPMSLVLAVACLPLLSLILLRTFWRISFTNTYWLASLLEICGFLIITNILVPETRPSNTWRVPSYAMHQAIIVVLTDWVMKIFNRSFREIIV